MNVLSTGSAVSGAVESGGEATFPFFPSDWFAQTSSVSHCSGGTSVPDIVVKFLGSGFLSDLVVVYVPIVGVIFFPGTKSQFELHTSDWLSNNWEFSL